MRISRHAFMVQMLLLSVLAPSALPAALRADACRETAAPDPAPPANGEREVSAAAPDTDTSAVHPLEPSPFDSGTRVSQLEPARGEAGTQAGVSERRRLLVPAELEPLLDAAIAKSPRLIAARGRLSSSHARESAAGGLEDPFASLSYQNDTLNRITLGTSEFSQIVFSYIQPLPGRGKRALRRESAGRTSETEVGAVKRAELDLSLDVIRAWWALAYERAARTALLQQKELVGQTEEAARSRYAVGQTSQQDVVRAQIEKARVAEALAITEAAIESLRAELRGHLCLAPGETLPDPGELPEIPQADSIDEEVARATRESPEIEQLEKAAVAADARVELAKGDYKADYTLGGSYMYRGSLDPMVAFSLGVRLPLFRKNRLDPSLAAASGDADAIRADAESFRIQLGTLTARRAQTVRAARESVRLLREAVLPLDRLALETALSSYRTGQGEFVSLLGGLGRLLSDRLEVESRRLLIVTESAALETVSLDPPAGLSAGGPPLPALRAMEAERGSPAVQPPDGSRPAAGGPMGGMP